MAFLIVVPLFALLGLGFVALYVVQPVGMVMLGAFILVTLFLFVVAQARMRRRRPRRVKPTPSHLS